MNVHQFANFLRMQGYRVIETKSCYWYTNSSRFFYQSFPYHRGISLSKEEIINFFSKSHSFAARYLICGEVSDKDKSIWICDNKDYDLKSLPKNSRNKIRRGLERCNVERIDFDWLASNGMPLIRDTLYRQNRPENSLTENMWKKLCFAAKKTSDFEAWASFADGKLAAFKILCIVEDYAYFLENYSSTEHLKYYYPNNVLTFVVIREMFTTHKVRGVITGVEPFEELKGLSKHKIQMGYERKHLKQIIVLNPIVRPFLNKLTMKIVENIMSKSNTDFSKRMSGFIKSYRMQTENNTKMPI